jgi:hypothetical protein
MFKFPKQRKQYGVSAARLKGKLDTNTQQTQGSLETH